MYMFKYKISMCSSMSSVVRSPVVVRECLKQCSVKNMERSLARITIDAVSNSGSATTLKASLPTTSRGLTFFATTPRNQNGWKEARQVTSADLLTHNPSYIQK